MSFSKTYFESMRLLACRFSMDYAFIQSGTVIAYTPPSSDDRIVLMGMLFISHSSKDSEISKHLASVLKDKGYRSVFLDIDPEAGIHAGEEWQAILYRRLSSCSALVAVVTDHFLQSQWCFTEVALARMQGKYLFGIRAMPLADGTRIPALLTDRQLVDGRTDFDGAIELVALGLKKAGLSTISSRAWDRSRPPYPGFSSFEEADSGVYFGRDEDIERGLEIVRGGLRGTASRMSLLLGASGSGKSSLLRAGMLPRLRSEEELSLIGPFRPGPEPLDELAWQITNTFGVEDSRVAALRSNPPGEDVSLNRIVRQLLREKGDRRRHALIMVDQFEELLSRPEGHPSFGFLTIVQHALLDVDGCISLLGTLRSDQLGQFQAHPATQHLDWQTLFVRPLDEAKLREIIEEPARLAELDLELGLTDRLIADTTSPHALPLLALTLRRLWERYGDDGLLQIEEYTQLGGIHGAVARVAEDALAGVSDRESLEALRKALMMMVRLDDNGNAVRQPVRWDDVPVAAHTLLHRFVRSRLLVRERDDIQVAHEALFTAWRRMREWIEEGRQALIVQQQISQAVRAWEENRDESDLWRGIRLDRAIELWETGRLALGDTESAFLQESRSAQEVAVEEKQRREREREHLSRVALGRGLAYQALGEAQDRPQRGLLLAIEAVKATLDYNLGGTTASINALRDLLCRFGGESIGDFNSVIRCFSFDEAGRYLALGCEDGTVAVVELDQSASIWHSWHYDESAIADVTLEGHILATQAHDGTVRVYDLDTSEFLEHAPGGSKKTVSALSGGGHFLAIAHEGEAIRIHDLIAQTDRPLLVEESATTVLSFSPDGQWLADGRDDGRLVLWELATVKDQPRVILIQAHQEAIENMVWATENNCFVTYDNAGYVRRWEFGDTPGELTLTELPSSGSSILDLRVSAAGDLVVAGTWHSETLCWMQDDGFSEPVVLGGHSSSISSVTIHPSGQWLATASSRDNFALLWPTRDLRTNPRPISLRGEDRWLNVVAFAPTGTIVTGSSAGTVRRWIRTPEEPQEIPIPGVDLNNYVISRDGRQLISAGAKVAFGGSPDNRGKLVSLSDGRIEVIEDPPDADAVAMTPDGHTIVVGSGSDEVVRVYNRSTGLDRRLSFKLKGWYSHVAIDPSGRWLVVEGGDGPALVDLEAGNAKTSLDLHKSFLRYAAFDEKSMQLLTADANGVVALWRIEESRFELARSLQHDGVWWCAFRHGDSGWVAGSDESLLVVGPGVDASPLLLDFGWQADKPEFALSLRADRIAVAGGVQAASWDMGAASILETRVELPRHEGLVSAIAVSTDGRQIATSMIDGPVRLWQASNPSNPVVLPQLQRYVMLLAFTDDDRHLITGEQHGTVDVWDLNVHSMIARAHRVAGRELTDEERSRFLDLRE